MTDYLLISQSEMRVCHYMRKSPTQWTVTDYCHPDDVIVLAPLGMAFTLAAIYQEMEQNDERL